MKAPVIHLRQRMQRLVPMRAMGFFFRQFDQPFEMAHVTILQQRIEQHRAQRRRERQRQARFHAVRQPASIIWSSGT